MPKQSPFFKTEPVKNYLLQRINRAGGQPERLPGEIELCRKFGVSRITVRRAIKALEDFNYIIRLPQRKGAFSNPEMSRAIPCIIGILCGDGGRNYITNQMSAVLSVFWEEFNEVNCDFEFAMVNINIHDPEESGEELLRLSYDGIFWLHPAPEAIPTIDALIRRGFPVVTVTPPYAADFPEPVANCIAYDHADIGRYRGMLIREHGHRHIIYIGLPNITYQNFVATLDECGKGAHTVSKIGEVNDIESKLRDLLRKNPETDAIISDGREERFQALFHVLKDEDRKIKLYLDAPNAGMRPDLAACLPKSEIFFFDESPRLRACGRESGKFLKQMIEGEIKRFESMKIKIPYIGKN